MHRYHITQATGVEEGQARPRSGEEDAWRHSRDWCDTEGNQIKTDLDSAGSWWNDPDNEEETGGHAPMLRHPRTPPNISEEDHYMSGALPNTTDESADDADGETDENDGEDDEDDRETDDADGEADDADGEDDEE